MLTLDRDRAAGAGVALGTALLVLAALQYSGGYYALAGGLTGAAVVIAATAVVVLGFEPSLPAVCAAASLVAVGSFSALSIAWGGVPHTSWRFAGLLLSAAAAVLVGSSLAARVHALASGVLGGIGVHVVIVLVTVGSGSAPHDWFQGRQLEGPIGYHNGEGTICAMGAPLALWLAASSRRLVRAAGAALVVLLLAVAFLTQSRGSLAAIAIAIVVQVLLARRARLAALAGFLTLASVALFLSLRAVDRALLDERPLDDPAFTRYVVLAFALAVVIGVLSLPSLPPLRLTRRQRNALLGACGGVAVAIVAVAAVVLLPRVDELRGRLTAEPNSPSQVAAGDTRLSSFSPTGRIELWRVALRMSAEKPVAGSGTGSFSPRWGIERTNKDAYVLQPHSVELETLAELGIAGFALLAAAIASIAWCIVRGLRRDRAVGAAVAGSLAAFFLVASVDWTYEFAGIIIPALLLTGAAAGDAGRRIPSTTRTLSYIVAMLLVLGVLAGPAMAQRQLDQAKSQENVSLEQAWATAASARSWDRWDPAVVEFQGLVAEREGRFEVAAGLYRRAATLSLQPWNDSYREARALQRAGLTERSLDACRRAIASNPLEPVLRRGVCEDAE